LAGKRGDLWSQTANQRGRKTRQHYAAYDAGHYEPNLNHECRPATGLLKPRRFVQIVQGNEQAVAV
jgi:hypothetical protein